MKELKEIELTLNCIENGFKKVSYPRSVVIEVSSRCNLECVQCAHSYIKRKKEDMKFDLFKKIIDDIAANSIHSNVWFSNYGEPLMVGEYICDMLTYADQKGISNTYMNTNAVLLTEEAASWLIKGNLGHLIAGIDGYSAPVYEKIRLGAKRDDVFYNVLSLKRKLDEQGKITPRIEAQFIVMDENEHELEEYKKFWAEHGIAVRIRNRITWAGKVSGKELNPKIKRIACGNTFSTCHIIQSGHVTACGNDVDAQYIIGDLNKESISEVWRRKNEHFIELQLRHRFDELPEYCRNCIDWQAIGTVDYDESGRRYYREYELINKLDQRKRNAG